MATEEASTLDADLISLAKECRVPQEYHEILQGFDVPLFGCLVSEASQLDTALSQLLENSEEPESAAGKLRLLSSLRLLFESCKKQSSEIMMADRQLWGQMSDLVNLHNWSLDDALTEYTEVRGDMASLLQPRMAPPRRPDPPAPHLRTGRGGKGKNKGEGKGKRSSGGQGIQSSTGGAKWVTKFEDKGKTRFL
ncbi:unnamed protein product, partial [Symbiodinium microadriaticum]